jgi:hypothetical protein
MREARRQSANRPESERLASVADRLRAQEARSLRASSRRTRISVRKRRRTTGFRRLPRPRGPTWNDLLSLAIVAILRRTGMAPAGCYCIFGSLPKTDWRDHSLYAPLQYSGVLHANSETAMPHCLKRSGGPRKGFCGCLAETCRESAETCSSLPETDMRRQPARGPAPRLSLPSPAIRRSGRDTHRKGAQPS